MAFPPRGDNGFLSVASFLEALPRLGLPHFQRGQVWTDGAVSRLLESLALDTPCGSIILWAPSESMGQISELGVPVSAWGTTTVEYLVVDGQQRLTALSRVFGNLQDWALNLASLPWVWASGSENRPSGRLRKRPLFTPMPRDPGPDVSASRRGRYKAQISDLVPLDQILARGAQTWPYDFEPPARWATLARGVRAIPHRKLQVVVKREETLEEIIRLYNRINSSGVVVKEEERAFAAMVSFNPAAGEWLRRSFSAVHQEDKEREEVLKRQRENRFGFKLFVRTFAQAAAHHMDRNNIDLSTFDDYLWKSEWMEDLGRRQAVFGDASHVLQNSARVLRETLGCDDFRFLPSAEGLRPAFALLLKYPNVSDEIVARTILSLQLTGSVLAEREDDRELIRRIRKTNTLGEALSALPRLGTRTDLEKRLHKSQSMQDRWVSLLYWLQRSLGARDYGGKFANLSIDVSAHKEHIVPFSKLHPLYEELESKGGHGRTHIANAIGNLTFLSASFNFEHGADIIELWKLDSDLLYPHQLDRPEVLKAYKAIFKKGKPVEPRTYRRRYEKFVNLRTQAVADEMYRWLSDWMNRPAPTSNLRPAPQRVSPSPEDGVRAKSWPEPFEMAFLRLLRNAGKQRNNWILHRQGRKAERNRVINHIRLDKDGTRLYVGNNVKTVEAIVEALAGYVETEEGSSQWQYNLDPFSPASAELLETLEGVLPSKRR